MLNEILKIELQEIETKALNDVPEMCETLALGCGAACGGCIPGVTW